MRPFPIAALAAGLLAAPSMAQLEEGHLPFVAADEAFDLAARTGKRVLVYQDWPG